MFYLHCSLLFLPFQTFICRLPVFTTLNMATEVHCAYCFEILSSSLEQRGPLSLRQVEQLWKQWSTKSQTSESIKEDADADDSSGNAESHSAIYRPASVSRLLESSPEGGQQVDEEHLGDEARSLLGCLSWLEGFGCEREEQQQQALQHGLYGNVYINVNEAISNALQHAHPTDAILVCGSVFVIGEINGITS